MASDLTLPWLDLVRATTVLGYRDRTTGDASAEGDTGTADETLGTMDVRFSKFNTWYEIDSWWEGTFLERTIPGAFQRTIKNTGASRFKVLFDHGYDPHIGNKILGVPDAVTEEKDSPLGVVPLLDTTYNRDLVPGLRAGGYGSSFRFQVLHDEWVDEPEPSDHNPQGIPERTIHEVRMYEFGPVTWPANPDSTAGLRSVCGMTDDLYERIRRQDPQRYDSLSQRMRSLRTSGTMLARFGRGTFAPEPANARPSGSPPAPGGLSANARARALALLELEGQ